MDTSAPTQHNIRSEFDQSYSPNATPKLNAQTQSEPVPKHKRMVNKQQKTSQHKDEEAELSENERQFSFENAGDRESTPIVSDLDELMADTPTMARISDRNHSQNDNLNLSISIPYSLDNDNDSDTPQPLDTPRNTEFDALTICLSDNEENDELDLSMLHLICACEDDD